MKILIVDDSPATRTALAEVVGRMPGAEIDEAGDGAAAVKALSGSSYDLIFLDIYMPVMDGLKLLGWLMKAPGRTASTRVAVLTAAEHPMTRAQARGLGARYFVQKPVQTAEVQRILDEVFPATGTRS
jgi:two-component system chemotaxis response regulator CheY